MRISGNNKGISNCDLNNKTKVESIVIEDGITSVGTNAFNSYSSLETVTIPNSVTSIGNYAFDSCSNLSVITYLGINNPGNESQNVFNGCADDLIIYVTQSYQSDLFCGRSPSIPGHCDDDVEWILKDGVMRINGNNKGISNCDVNDKTKVESIVIEDGITSIGDDAFNSYSSLETVTIPNSVTSIGDYAFYGCSRLSSVTYLGVNDPGNQSTGVFDECSDLINICVTKLYLDETFCGGQVSGSCNSPEPSTSSSSSETPPVISSSSSSSSSATSPPPSLVSSSKVSGNNDGDSNGGMIAGIVVGCVAAAAIIGAVVFFFATSGKKYGKVDESLFEEDPNFISMSVL